MGHSGLEVKPGTLAATAEAKEGTAERFYVKSKHIISLVMMMFWAKRAYFDRYLSTRVNLMFESEFFELAENLIIINRRKMFGHVNMGTGLGRII